MEDKKEEHHHTHSAHHPHKKNKVDILLIAAIALGIILIINIFLAFGISQNLKKNIEAAKEAAKPAEIQLVLIKNSRCTECFDAAQVISYVKSQKVELLSEKTLEFGSTEAKSLISKYKIEKIPAVLVTGELDKLNIQGFSKVRDALVFSQINPPFTDPTSGRVKGLVSLKLITDPSCDKCDKLGTLLAQISFAGIKIAEQRNITATSEEGKSLTSKYNIDFVPTLILSEDAGEYLIIQQAWAQIGTKEEDAYVLRTVYPPFINLTIGKLRGLISITYLNDTSCTECYDVSTHKLILSSPQSYAMAFDKEEVVDLSSNKGKELVQKYNITKVPTVVLSAEMGVYPSSAGLRQFFSIEKDNSYVFRQLDVIGAYKDLAINSVINPQQQGQEV